MPICNACRVLRQPGARPFKRGATVTKPARAGRGEGRLPGMGRRSRRLEHPGASLVCMPGYGRIGETYAVHLPRISDEGSYHAYL